MEISFETFDHHRDLSAQRELFRDCFPETIGTSVDTVQHYLWKFHGFPSTPPSFEYVAWDKQRQILGYYAALPYKYRYQNLSFVCGMVCDVMTHSRARGRGVFTKIGRFATDDLSKRGLSFTTGYPIRPEVVPGHLKVGWKVLFSLPLRLRILRTRSILRKLGLELLTPFADAVFAMLAQVTRGKPSPLLGVQIHDSQTFLTEHAASYEVFYQKWAATQTIVLEKSTEFLRWRLGAPATNYQIITVLDQLEVVACAIVRPTILKEIPTLAVLDIMHLEDRPESLACLYAELELTARRHNLETISLIASSHTSKRLQLRKFGYLPTPYAFKLILKSLQEISGVPLANETSWNLMWLDSDDL